MAQCIERVCICLLLNCRAGYKINLCVVVSCASLSGVCVCRCVVAS